MLNARKKNAIKILKIEVFVICKTRHRLTISRLFVEILLNKESLSQTIAYEVPAYSPM